MTGPRTLLVTLGVAALIAWGCSNTTGGQTGARAPVPAGFVAHDAPTFSVNVPEGWEVQPDPANGSSSGPYSPTRNSRR